MNVLLANIVVQIQFAKIQSDHSHARVNQDIQVMGSFVSKKMMQLVRLNFSFHLVYFQIFSAIWSSMPVFSLLSSCPVYRKPLVNDHRQQEYRRISITRFL